MLAALPNTTAALSASVVTDSAIRAHAWAALRTGPILPVRASTTRRPGRIPITVKRPTILEAIMEVLVAVARMLVCALVHPFPDLRRHILGQMLQPVVETFVFALKVLMRPLMELFSHSGMLVENSLVGLRVGLLETPKALPHVGLLLLHHLAELLGVFLLELMKPLPLLLKLFAAALVLCGLRRERAGHYHQRRHHHPKRQCLHRLSLLV